MPPERSRAYRPTCTTALRMWSTEEVAHFLCVPVATVYAWRKHRQGPKAYRIGKHLRFKPEDVTAWLEQQSA